MELDDYLQVDDDIDLLQEMLDCLGKSDGIFHWTNYWDSKCNKLVGYIREYGLSDYRRIRAPKHTAGHYFMSFGAVDHINNENVDEVIHRVRAEQLDSAISFDFLPASRVGNPEGFLYNDVFYTVSWLYYYLRYNYVTRFFSPENKTIVEIGSGSGKQAHLLKLAHPSATIILFDIPPQLYVANQYLKAVLPGSTVAFEDTRNVRSLNDLPKGKIYLFGNWEIPLLIDFKFDLLWNAASFQEMEPEVVEFYLQNCRGASNVYLMQAMAGQTLAPQAGMGGVLRATTIDTYRAALERFEILDISPATFLPIDPCPNPYSESFWTVKCANN